MLRGGSLALAVAIVVSGVVLGGCGDYGLDFTRRGPGAEKAKRKPELWTMFEIRSAIGEGRPVAPTRSFPFGLPDLFLKGPPSGPFTLKINAAFSEGDAAAFVIPEVWLNYDVMWVQPWYFLVTAWNEKTPNANRWKMPDGTTNVPAVWDVGPRSLFYSPLWLVFYAVVDAANTPQDRYDSAEKIFNDKLPIHEGPPIIYSVRPDDVGLEAKNFHPYITDKEVGGLSAAATSWIDGEKMAYFIEGGNNWRYNDKLEAEEVPLYFLARRNGNGDIEPVGGWPPVMGSGPVFGRRPTDAPNGRPRFGGYSRMYFALVGANAEAFNPDEHPLALDSLRAKGFDPNAYRGRVANNGKKVLETDKPCFTQPDFPAGCVWLDSQARVEDTVGVANIFKTEVTACSPLVFYGGKGIGR